MPVITFDAGKLAPETKQKLITSLTDAAATATGMPRDKFIVFLRELDHENIGIGGVNLEEILRQREATK